jgi:excisionase family DNA binding protein
MNTKERPEWLTVSEIAAELRVTDRVVYKWIREEILQAVRFGGVWRVSREEFERFTTPTEKAAA